MIRTLKKSRVLWFLLWSNTLSSAPISVDIYARMLLTGLTVYDKAGSEIPGINYFEGGEDYIFPVEVYSHGGGQVSVSPNETHLGISAPFSIPSAYHDHLLADAGTGGYLYIKEVFSNSVIDYEDVSRVEIDYQYAYGIQYMNENPDDFKLDVSVDLSGFPDEISGLDRVFVDFKPEMSFDFLGSGTISRNIFHLFELENSMHRDVAIFAELTVSPTPAPIPVISPFWLFASGIPVLFRKKRQAF